jgi:methyl-accepting chemotaxis protein
MNVLLNMKIRSKLMVIIIGCGFALICLGLVGLSGIRTMSKGFTKEFATVQEINNVHELRSTFLGLRIDVLYQLVVEDGASFDAKVEGYRKKAATIKEITSRMSKEDMSPVERDLLSSFSKSFESYLTQAEKLIPMAREGIGNPVRRHEALAFAVGSVAPMYSGAEASILKMTADSLTRAREVNDTNFQFYHRATQLLVCLVILFIVGGAGTGLVIAASINSSLRNVTGRVHDIAEGEGDLTKRINIRAKDEVGEMAGYIDLFIHKVQDTVSQSVETANETAVASNELSHISHNLATNVINQFHLAEQSQQLMTDVVNNLDVTEEMAITTTETLESTQKILLDFVAALNAVGAKVIDEGGKQAELANRMKTLTEQASGINEVLTIIADIADQTNLLALNASIEAARAGESGRGFAVVADEVRNLASKTQSSLNQINNNVKTVVQGIESMYNETARSSEQMMDISQNASKLMEQAGATGEQLEGSVEISSNLVKRSTYIATKTKELIKDMNSLVALSDQNKVVAEEVGDVSVNLARKSEDLKTSLGRFRV